MRLLLMTLLVAFVPIALADAPTTRPSPAASEDGIAVYFSPDGGAAAAVVAAIDSATRTLDVAAYSYTHADIAKATVEAHRRGVNVRVILDKTQSSGRYSSATFLFNAGVPVRIENVAGIMHSKYLVIDGATVITGSMNLTRSADEANAENLLVIEGKPQIAAAYVADYERLLARSELYRGIQKDH